MTSPMARLQQKKQAAVTTGSAGSTGIPCAMGYALYRALPGDHRLVATVARGTDPATLAPASERQDHTTSPSAYTTFVSRAIRVHRIPASRVVTIRAYVPLHRGGMRESIVVICPTRQAPIPATDWHDGQFAHGVHPECTCRASECAAVTAESVRIDSEIGASLRHCKRPHISSATNGRRSGTLETRRGL
jgi:hypothetical protein